MKTTRMRYALTFAVCAVLGIFSARAAATERLVRNLAKGRYDLPPGSPAIDVVPKAAATGMAAVDLKGNPRLNGPGYDLGAFEKIQHGLTILVR